MLILFCNLHITILLYYLIDFGLLSLIELYTKHIPPDFKNNIYSIYSVTKSKPLFNYVWFSLLICTIGLDDHIMKAIYIL